MNKKKSELLNDIIILLAIALIPILFIISIISQAIISEEETIIIEEKFVVWKGNTDWNKIMSEDNQTFNVRNQWLRLKFNSEDLYNQLEEGQKCKIKTTGYEWRKGSRIENLKNIIEAECEETK